MYALGFLLPLALPALVWLGGSLGGAWLLLVPGFLFGALPVLDRLGGVDASDRDATAATPLRTAYFRGVLYAYAVMHFAMLWWALGRAPAFAPLELVVFAVGVGIVTGGVGITVAHELGHKRGALPRGVARALLASVAYEHFIVEHNKGHHGRVATPDDPASAPLGMSFWRFLPRTVFGGIASAWGFERERLARAGLSAWHPSNELLWGPALTIALFAAGFARAGAAGLVLLAVQAAVAILLLELVNYVEHYGLARAAHPDGGFARVTAHHSWNASQRVTNWFLFNLQRHSHHHVDQGRRYESLRHCDDSPQLPAGYAEMLLLALLPPLWFRVMDPLTQRYRAAYPDAAGAAA